MPPLYAKKEDAVLFFLIFLQHHLAFPERFLGFRLQGVSFGF